MKLYFVNNAKTRRGFTENIGVWLISGNSSLPFFVFDEETNKAEYVEALPDGCKARAA